MSDINIMVIKFPENMEKKEPAEIRILIEGEITVRDFSLITESDWEAIRGVVYDKITAAIEKNMPPLGGGMSPITAFKKATERRESE